MFLMLLWIGVLIVLEVSYQVWARRRRHRCADCGSKRRTRRCLYCRRRVCPGCRPNHTGPGVRWSGWCCTSWARPQVGS